MPRTFAAIAVLALSAAATAQARTALGHSGRDYLPLVPGTVWRYARTSGGGGKVEVEVECRGDALAEMRRCSEMEVRAPGGTTAEHWGADRDGVWQHTPRGGAAWDPPQRLLFCPLGVQWRWEWEQTVQTDRTFRELPGGVLFGVPESRTFVERHRATIADLDARVAVPAGTFPAVRVMVEVTGEEDCDWRRTVVWFAKGVGIVRREEYRRRDGEPALMYRDELTAFVPVAAGPDALALARACIAARPELWPAGAGEFSLVALPLGPVAAPSAFVRTGAAQGPPFVRVTRGEAVAFDPTRVEDVAALLAADAPPQGPTIEARRLATFARRYLGLRHAAADGTVPAIAVQLARSDTHLENGRLLQRALFVSDHGLLELCLRGGRLESFAYMAR